MDVGASGLREPLEKIFGQFCLKIADALGADLATDGTVWSTAEIDRRSGESFVHWHQKIAGAEDAAFVADGFRDGLAQRDAGVFDRVMLIDVEVALRFDCKIERAVTGDKIEHVIEKSDSGRYARFAASVDIQAQCDFCLVRLAMDCGGAWHFVCSAILEEALDEFEQALHLFLRADAHADVPGRDVSAITQNNFVFGQIDE